MIGKSGSGAGFGGLTRYLLMGGREDPNPGRVLWTSTRELAVDDPHDAAVVMRATAAQGKTDKPVQHLSISLAPGEHLSREQWEQVIETTLRDLGLEGHQALVVAHRDTAHEHVHIVVNRVHPDTHLAWDRWQDRPRLMASLRKQELALGLRPTPHVKDPDRLPDALVQGFERTGEPPFLDYARAVARPLFQDATSWTELHEGLAEQGLYLERKGQGLVVSDDRRQVKASAVDREASLGALERRLGRFEPRAPVLDELDRSLRAEQRQQELAAELAPVRYARFQVRRAEAGLDAAAQRVSAAQHAIYRAAESVYRDPFDAASRLVARLDAGDALSEVDPRRFGALRGTALRAGRYALLLDSEAHRAYEVAASGLPRLAKEYRQARHDVDQARSHLEDQRRDLALLEQRHRPQVEEMRRLETIGQLPDLQEKILSLRPRDQLALARAHGSELLKRAAEVSVRDASRSLAAREWWLRNLAPQLDRALDRRLDRARLRPPAHGQTLADWTAKALRRGLRPLHAAQALVRSGASAEETVQAVSRSIVGRSVRKATTLAAKALGLPVLPLRLASIGWSIARGVTRALTR